VITQRTGAGADPRGTATRAGILLLLAAGAGFAAPAETDPLLSPRRLSEIKAMIDVLDPDAAGNRDPQTLYLQRLRQHRFLCGVPFEDIALDGSYQVLAQHAAMICARLGKLTHNPERPAGLTDEVFDLCKRGAAQSNLFMGITQPVECVDGWMNDSDPSNITVVGHRRWCLNPRMVRTAFGSEGNYAAMHAHDGSRKQIPDWDLVAYPARGWMPAEFFGPRHAWSVSLNPETYAAPSKGEVKVEIRPAGDKGAPDGPALKLDHFSVDNGGFGTGAAVIFRPEGASFKVNQRYVVAIDGLKTKGGQAAPLRYTVHFVNLHAVPDGPDTRGVYTSYLQRRLKAAQALTDRVDQLDALGRLAEDRFLGQADPAVGIAVRAAMTELLKDAALRREHEANQKYRLVADAESKSGHNKNKQTQAALGYRELSQVYKETRAGQRAAEDFKRLQAVLQ
jgi:hypothetical protein